MMMKMKVEEKPWGIYLREFGNIHCEKDNEMPTGSPQGIFLLYVICFWIFLHLVFVCSIDFG